MARVVFFSKFKLATRRRAECISPIYTVVVRVYTDLEIYDFLEFHTEFYGSIIELMMYGVHLSIYPY
jgi:hypothetical protein